MVEESEFNEIMCQIEKMLIIRDRGFCYVNPDRLELAQMLANRINVNVTDWLDVYYDYDRYN